MIKGSKLEFVIYNLRNKLLLVIMLNIYLATFNVCIHVLLCAINPLTAKLFNLNFHPLEVVSRWFDLQLQVIENYSDLTK